MGVADRYEKRKKLEENTSVTSGGVEYRRKVKNAPNVAKDIKSRLEQWSKDSQSLLDGYNSRFFDKDGQYITNTYRSSEDAGNWLNDAETKRGALETESNAIKSLLTDYGEFFDENIVKDINDMLGSNTEIINSVVSNALIDKEYWDKFENESAWKESIQAQKDCEAISTFDLEAGFAEIEGLRSQLKEANSYSKEILNLKQTIDSDDMRLSGLPKNDPYRIELQAKIDSNKARFNELMSKYGGEATKSLEATINEKQAYYNQAKYIQDGIKMASVANPESELYDPNFNKYVEMGKAYYDKNHPNNLGVPAVNFDQKGYVSATAEAVGDFAKQLHSFEYKNMTDDEREIYHYYLGKAVEEANGGKVSEKTAEKYVNLITQTINARHSQTIANDLKNKGKLAQLTFSLYSGVESWATGVENFFSSEDYIPPTATALASQKVREDLAKDGGGWKVAYDIGNTTANMFPSIALSYIPVVGQGLSLASTGISSAGHAYAEALNNGYTKGQARGYSLLVGGSETGLQYLLGGISRLGGVATKGATSKIATKLASNVGNAYAKIAISSGVKLVGSMVSEFGEEYLQEVLTPVFKNIALGTEEDVKLFSTDALYAGFLGALSAALLEGGSVISGEIGTYKTGKSIVEKGQAENLAKLGMSYSADTVAHKIASKVNKDTDAYTLGQLLHEVGADHLSAQNIADITAELERKGMTLSDAQSIAKWLNKAVEGGVFTKSQRAALENNEIIDAVFRDVILNRDSSVNQRVQEYQSINENLAQERTKATAKSEKLTVLDENVVPYSSEYIESVAKVYEEMGLSPEQAKNMAVAQLSQPDSNTSSSATKNSSQSKFEVSDDGKTINLKTGETVAISKIDSISESGEVKLTVDNGVVVKASDVSFGTVAERAFIEEISNLKLGKNRISTASANALYQNAMTHLKSNPDMTLDKATTLIKGLAESYIYGAYNFGEDRLTATDENGRKIYYAGEISDSARRLAYKLGQNDSVAKAKADQKVIDDLISNAEPKSIKKGLGKLVYEDGIEVDKSSLTDTQKANIKGIELLSKITNIEFHIFRSDKAGETYMYTMPDGTVTSANGWYVAGTNEIWVDLNAGNFGQGTMIRTAAHEISHYIKEWSPKQWQAMADLLMDTFNKNGVDTQRMLNKQKDKIRRRYNKENMPSEPELTEKAYEEFVCDALTDILTDGSIVNFIAEVKQKNKSLGKKLLDTIKNLLSSWGIIIDDYKSRELETDEAQALSQFEDVFKKLQEMYQNALMDADAAYAAVGTRNLVDFSEAKNTESEIKFSDKKFDYVNLSDSDYFTNGKIYSFDFLTSQKDMVKVKLPETGLLANKKGKIDDEKVLSEGIKNALSEGTERDGKVYVKNVYTGRELRIDNSTIKHGLDGTYNRHLTNARIGSVIGSVVKNAIPINGLKNTSTIATGTYAMVSYCYDSRNRQFIAVITVEQHTGNIDSFQLYDVAHAISGRQKKGSQVDTKSQGVYPIEATTISISDLIKIVNSTHQSILSNDVLSHLGETRNPKGSYSDKILFSERDSSASNRSILASSLESVVQNDIERKKLAQYKEKISLIEAEEKRLAEIQKQLFTKGAVEPAQRKKLQFEARQISNRINTYDRQLLNLESTTALKNVLNREKALAMKKQKQKDAEVLKQYREKAAKNQRELIERHQESRKKATESRHKTAMRHQIKNVVNELNQLLLKGSKERNVKLGLQSAVASALEAVNMDTIAADERIAKLEQDLMKAKTPEKIQEISRKIDNIREQGGRMASKLEALKKAYENIKANKEDSPEYYRAEASLIEERIASVIGIVGDTPLRNMSLYQLEAVYDLYSMVLATVRNANSVFVQGKLEDLQKNAADTMEEISAIRTLPEERVDRGWISSFSWNEMIPIYAFRRIGSQTFEKFFWEAIQGQNTVAKDRAEANDFAKATREKYGYSKWDLDKVHEFELADGRTFRITLKHMMSIYAYSKRHQALDHMTKGGFFFNDKSTFRKKGGIIKLIKSNEVGYCIGYDTLETIIKEMSDEQIKYVDEMQTYLTKMGDKGNEVSRVLWGIDIFKEKVYFPLKSVKDFIFQANQTAQESSLKNDGMTKETKPGASNPIVLEAFDDVWANHVNRMSQYHGLVLPIENLNKIHNYGTWSGTDSVSVSTMLKARFGEAVNDYVNQFIKDLNGASSTSGASNPFFSFVGKFKKTAVAASASVVVQQPTAIIRATAVLDSKCFVGMPEAHKLSTKWAEVKKYAPIAIIKEIGGFDAGAGRQATQWLNSDTLRGVDKVAGKIDDITMIGAAIGDQIGWCAIWEAVKREVKATTNLEVDSEEFLNKVGERFTEVIVLTQVYDSTLSRSGFMRSKHDSVKMLTSFMGELTVSFNMMLDATTQAKRGTITKRKAGRIIGAVYASIIAASVMASLIYALRDDDEDESYIEKFLEAFGGKLLGDINPLNMLPGVRDIISIFDGWDVERTDMAVFKDIKDAFDGLSSESKSPQRKIEDFAGAIASAFGLPLKNALRSTREVYNGIKNIFDDITPSNIGDAFVRGITGEKKDKSEALYNAIVNGDEARLKIYRKGYKDDKTYETALRKALRENEPRVKKAAEARFDGDFSEYERLFEEIEAEGNFEFGTIRSAIDAEFNKLYDGDKDESSEDDTGEENVKSIYRTSDINVAFENGDTSSALEIIEDIVKVKTENYINNGEKKQDAEKKAKSSVKSSMTSYWKPLYISAYQNKDNDEMKRIRNILLSSGLYGRANDVVKTGQDWIKSSK